MVSKASGGPSPPSSASPRVAPRDPQPRRFPALRAYLWRHFLNLKTSDRTKPQPRETLRYLDGAGSTPVYVSIHDITDPSPPPAPAHSSVPPSASSVPPSASTVPPSSSSVPPSTSSSCLPPLLPPLPPSPSRSSFDDAPEPATPSTSVPIPPSTPASIRSACSVPVRDVFKHMDQNPNKTGNPFKIEDNVKLLFQSQARQRAEVNQREAPAKLKKGIEKEPWSVVCVRHKS